MHIILPSSHPYLSHHLVFHLANLFFINSALYQALFFLYSDRISHFSFSYNSFLGHFGLNILSFYHHPYIISFIPSIQASSSLPHFNLTLFFFLLPFIFLFCLHFISSFRQGILSRISASFPCVISISSYLLYFCFILSSLIFLFFLHIFYGSFVYYSIFFVFRFHVLNFCFVITTSCLIPSTASHFHAQFTSIYLSSVPCSFTFHHIFISASHFHFYFLSTSSVLHFSIILHSCPLIFTSSLLSLLPLCTFRPHVIHSFFI